jgi:dTDP-4-dehydrorhamnose reductase
LVEVEAEGVLHVTNSGSCTWFEFAQKILDLTLLSARKARVIPISSTELGRPAQRPANSVLDCSRFEQITGFRMRDWEEGLREYLSLGSYP